MKLFEDFHNNDVGTLPEGVSNAGEYSLKNLTSIRFVITTDKIDDEMYYKGGQIVNLSDSSLIKNNGRYANYRKDNLVFHENKLSILSRLVDRISFEDKNEADMFLESFITNKDKNLGINAYLSKMNLSSEDFKVKSYMIGAIPWDKDELEYDI